MKQNPLLSVNTPSPFIPIPLYTSNATDFGLIFDDFLQFDNLYQKPVFGDCVWTYPLTTSTSQCHTLQHSTDKSKHNQSYTDQTEQIYGAWLPVELMNDYRQLISQSGKHNVCRIVPQPARFNGKPIAFQVSVQSGKVTWLTPIQWKPPEYSLLSSSSSFSLLEHSRHEKRIHNSNSHKFNRINKNKTLFNFQTISFPPDFETQYKQFLLSLDGEREAIFPISGRVMNFTRKNSADPSNQLFDMIQYFEEFYTTLSMSLFFSLIHLFTCTCLLSLSHTHTHTHTTHSRIRTSFDE
jgi:hypothetical protein